MKVLIILPAFNESKNIDKVIDDLKMMHSSMDYIIINDGSDDDTVDICKQNDYKYINLPINLGIGGCMQTGYMYALEQQYDIAVQLDADGQHDSKHINLLIAPILDNTADIVIGSRFIDKAGFQSTGIRRMGINLLRLLLRICCGANIKDVTSGFRAVNKSFIKIFASDYAQDFPEPEAIITSMLYGCRIKEVPVVMKERISGESSIYGFKSLFYMIKVSISILLSRFVFTRRLK